jgi:nucleotide-binding universal stress UspA family protein
MDQDSISPSRKLALTLVEPDPSPETLRFSELVCNALNLESVLVHVAAADEAPEVGERLLDDAREMRLEKKADLKVLTGHIEQEILTELARRPYQLIILGTALERIEQAPSQLTRRLAEKANTSVLVIRQPPQALRNILICTGGRPRSVPAIKWGIQLAKATDAKTTILHVAGSPPAMYTGLDALEEGVQDVLERDSPLGQHLRDAAAMAEEAGIEANIELRHGIVAEEILRACDITPCDLIVIGAPKPGAFLDRLILGRVGPQLLASNPRSTLITRSETRSEDD